MHKSYLIGMAPPLKLSNQNLLKQVFHDHCHLKNDLLAHAFQVACQDLGAYQWLHHRHLQDHLLEMVVSYHLPLHQEAELPVAITEEKSSNKYGEFGRVVCQLLQKFGYGITTDEINQHNKPFFLHRPSDRIDCFVERAEF